MVIFVVFVAFVLERQPCAVAAAVTAARSAIRRLQ
jgi:hypothetical protein